MQPHDDPLKSQEIGEIECRIRAVPLRPVPSDWRETLLRNARTSAGVPATEMRPERVDNPGTVPWRERLGSWLPKPVWVPLLAWVFIGILGSLDPLIHTQKPSVPVSAHQQQIAHAQRLELLQLAGMEPFLPELREKDPAPADSKKSPGPQSRIPTPRGGAIILLITQDSPDLQISGSQCRSADLCT